MPDLFCAVCPGTVYGLLRDMGHSLGGNCKCLPSTSPSEPDAQFEFIAQLRRDCARDGIPTLSVDTNKC